MKRMLLIILWICTGVGQPIIAQDNMILISGGSYKMGDFTGKGNANEKPVHDVFLDTFYMSKYQLTVGEFKDFVEKSGYITDCEKKKGGKVFLIENGKQTFLHDSLASWKYVGYIPTDNQPVVFVSWIDAINYCNWKSKKENLQCCYEIIGDSVFWDKSAKGYRLLTEAEWEFVARSGGKNYKFAWGNDSLPMINGQKAANIKDETFKKANSPDVKLKPVWKGYEDGYLYTSPVGSFAPNELGFYDMCGNVYEWCWDWRDDDYYSKSPVNNPDGPATGKMRVCRNVGYACPIEQIGTTHRGQGEPNSFYDNVGFRIGRNK
jgi:formylglycine-generating enzyme required for sulfatase activity